MLEIAVQVERGDQRDDFTPATLIPEHDLAVDDVVLHRMHVALEKQPQAFAAESHRNDRAARERIGPPARQGEQVLRVCAQAGVRPASGQEQHTVGRSDHPRRRRKAQRRVAPPPGDRLGAAVIIDELRRSHLLRRGVKGAGQIE